jgi:O-antigen/teichoic acid export membrane protein
MRRVPGRRSPIRTIAPLRRSPETDVPVRIDSWREVFATASARIAMLPIGGAAALVTSRLALDRLGTPGFAALSLLLGMPALIPISDFGIGAAITDAAVRDGVGSAEFRSVWRRSLTILMTVGALTAAAGVVTARTGLWSHLLGLRQSSGIDTAIACVLVFLAAGMPLGAGQRVLLGAGKQRLATVLISCGPLASLAFTGVAVAAGTRSILPLAIAIGAGPLSAQLVVFMTASNRLAVEAAKTTALSVTLAPAASLDVPTQLERGRRLTDIGLPMGILTVTLPIAYQSDRVILSHVSGLTAVAQYSLVNIVYAPLFSVLTTAGAMLWPMFIRARPGQLRVEFTRALRIFGAVGLLIAIAIVAIGPSVTDLVGGHVLTAGIGVYASFALLFLVFAVHYPSGMLLMDHAGLWYQAIGSLLMVAANVPLSIYLSIHLGAAGPPLGSAISIVAFMGLPAFIRALRTISAVEVENACLD